MRGLVMKGYTQLVGGEMVRLVVVLFALLLALRPAPAGAQPSWHQAVVFYGSG